MIRITVPFTQPVNVQPGVKLLLKSAYDAVMANYIGGDGTTDIYFRYEVGPYELNHHLGLVDSNPIMFVDGGWIRRASTNPITDADIDMSSILSQGKSLYNQTHLNISSVPTIVKSVHLDTSVTPDHARYGVDDIIAVTITFSDPVVVKGTPVLVLDLGTYREALYHSGNRTATLRFHYKLQYGDTSSMLGYRFTPNALCVATGCPPNAVGSYIRQLSTNPTYDAIIRLNNLGLPNPRKTGVPFCNVTVDTTNSTRTTSIVSVQSLLPSGRVRQL